MQRRKIIRKEKLYRWRSKYLYMLTNLDWWLHLRCMWSGIHAYFQHSIRGREVYHCLVVCGSISWAREQEGRGLFERWYGWEFTLVPVNLRFLSCLSRDNVICSFLYEPVSALCCVWLYTSHSVLSILLLRKGR